jgi:MtrB/PioB family decaheme-associated outer membrane protein
MSVSRTVAAVLAGTVVLGAAAGAFAQTTLGGLRVEGEIEAGLRGFLTDEPKNKERAKFEEYRDMGAGAFLERLQFRFFTPDEGYSADVFGSKWGRQDQEFSLGAERLGLWQFRFDWDQTPHLISTTGRTVEHEVNRGEWRLPALRALSDFNGQATSRELHNIGVRWDTARTFFRLTPTPEWDVSAQYTRIRKDGDRPMSMVFGSPGGNFIELLQPIEQTVHDFRIGGTYAGESWQAQFNYTLSVFDNDLNRVIFGNPCSQQAALVATSNCTGGETPAGRTALRGQTALPPDNMAHTISAGGGVSLPLRTRLTANLAWSLRLQDQGFLPFTINSTVDGNPALRLPQHDLNGQVQTFSLHTQATSRPLPLPLTLSARYRMYKLDDLSDKIVIPAYVQNDQPAAGVLPTFNRKVALRSYFTKHNADVDGRYQVMQQVATTLGFGWERWDRDRDREVRLSDEYFVKAAVDVTPAEWLLARLTYKPSFRRDSNYNRLLDPANSPFGRRFDEAERDRQSVELMLQLTPVATLTVTPNVTWRHDDYITSTIGLKDESFYSAGVDVTWAPTERVSFSAGYMREVSFRALDARATNVLVNTEYLSNMEDTTDSFHVGGRYSLIRNLLDWTVNAYYATSDGSVQTTNPNANAGGPALTPAARAKRWPDFTDEMARVETALRYHLSKAWTASVFYAFETFNKHDWRTDELLPWNPNQQGTTGSIWLGNDLKDYDAHILGMTLTYRFK